MLLGDAYAPYAWVLLGLAATVPFRYLGHVFGITLSGSDAQGRRALAALVALLSNIALGVLLLPRFGVVGAVVAAVTGAGIVCAIYYREVVARFGSVDLLRPRVVAVSAGSLAAVAALGVRSALPEAAAVAVFVGAYAVALLVAEMSLRRLRLNTTRLDSATGLSSTISNSRPKAARNPSSE